MLVQPDGLHTVFSEAMALGNMLQTFPMKDSFRIARVGHLNLLTVLRRKRLERRLEKEEDY